MEKYIRTKDKIVKNPYLGVEQGIPVFELTADNMFLTKKDIVKTSNNLEDLCDGFVVKDYIPTKPLYFDTKLQAQQFVYKNGVQNDNRVEIYGAIWTDKGLIYVAKMNNKGNLELI